MSLKHILFIALASMVITNLPFSQNLTDHSLDRLLSLSGIKKQVTSYPSLVKSGLNQGRLQAPHIPQKMFDKMSEVAESSFNPIHFLDAISSEIKKNIDEKNAQQLFKWYESKIGKLITQHEEKASTPQAFEYMMRNSKLLLSDNERLDRANKLDSLLKCTELSHQMQKNMTLAVHSAITHAVEEKPDKAIEAFKSQLQTQDAEMLANSKHMVLLVSINSYKDVTISDLDKYLAFVGHPDTKKFNESVTKGLGIGFSRASQQLANKLAKVITKMRIDKNKESILENLAQE